MGVPKREFGNEEDGNEAETNAGSNFPNRFAHPRTGGTMRHRPGVTLVEVLVAIFIMAIAMLALLALFPLGALSMAQALKDDRCATCAVNAEAIGVALDVRHDTLVAGAFTNPFNLPTYNLTTATGYTGPSFGVIVDPFMYLQDPTHTVGPFAGPPATSVTPGVPRRSISFSQVAMTRVAAAGSPMTATEAARWCSMLDGVTWVRGDNVGANGVADTSPTGGVNIVRDGRYTWAWLLRRPLWYSDAVTDMSVIIYSGRPTITVTGEPTFPVVAGGALGTNSVTIDYSTTGVKPSIRNGGWILDVTPTTYTPPGGTPVQVVYGYPYRVVNATDTSATQVTLELQAAIRSPNNVRAITVLEFAVEIIDRGSFVQP